MAVGKTPNKENKNRAGQLSAEKGSYPSPQKRLQFTANNGAGYGSPDRSAIADDLIYSAD